MTPTLSLVLVGGLVVVLTLLRWPGRAELPKMSLGWHLVLSVAAGLLVWLLNLALWPDQFDGLAVGLLLGLEGLGAGLVSGFLLYGLRPITLPQRAKTKAQEAAPSGVVRVKQFGQTKGVLPSGVLVVWDDERGGWTQPDAPRSDRHDALAG